MVGRHATMFICYINDLHNYIYKIKLMALTLRLFSLIKTYARHLINTHLTSLQNMITIHNITGALPGDVTILSPYFCTVLSATLYTTSARFSKY
jgi:hypothetical protein